MISLEKGNKVDLTKGSQNTKFYVGLGWDAATLPGAVAYDLDASAIIAGADGKAISTPNFASKEYFVFYGNLSAPEGAVKHSGDNLTGQGDGDDERLIVDITKLPANATEVSVLLTIHEAQSRSQNFGGVKNAYIRICEVVGADEAGTELVRFDLSEDYSAFTAMQVGSIYKHGDEWKFSAVGTGFVSDLRGLLGHYGIV